MCFHDVPRYYDKEVHFVISLNLGHLVNTMVFLFPKCVILKRVGLVSWVAPSFHTNDEEFNLYFSNGSWSQPY